MLRLEFAVDGRWRGFASLAAPKSPTVTITMARRRINMLAVSLLRGDVL